MIKIQIWFCVLCIIFCCHNFAVAQNKDYVIIGDTISAPYNVDVTRNIYPFDNDKILINSITWLGRQNLINEGQVLLFEPSTNKIDTIKRPQLNFHYNFWNQIELDNGNRLFFLSDKGRSDTVKLAYYLTNNRFDSLLVRKQNLYLNTFNLFTYNGVQYKEHLYIVGWVQKYTNTWKADIYLAKLDTATLQPIWEKTYGLPNRNENPNSIKVVNNNLFISAMAHEGGAVSGSGYNLLLDTAGNIIWEKYYNTDRVWQNFSNGFFTTNGILNFGYVALPHAIYPNDLYRSNNALWVCLTDSNGNNQQDIIYDLGPWNDYLETCFKDNDGNFICVGGTNNVPELHQAGLMVKFNPQGDTLFTRVFDRSYNKPGYIDNITTGYQRWDGYYVLGGFTLSGLRDGNQDIWILITDTNGCVQNYPCMGVVTSLDNYLTENKIVVYPNPVYGVFNLLIEPEHFNQIKQLSVVNALGQTVKQLPLQTEQNIQELAAGLYTLQVTTQTGQIYFTKLIKQ